MSRYIDEEWLCNELGDTNMDIYTDEVKEYIDSAPSIDIVHCRECKKWNGMYCFLGYATHCPKAEDFCSYGSRSEKPNNCEHITEDGVTCAKYPACDDCPYNSLSKVKGSKRLVKGSEQTERSER